MWKWLKCLWREDRSYLLGIGITSVLFAAFMGLATFCLLIAVQR